MAATGTQPISADLQQIKDSYTSSKCRPPLKRGSGIRQNATAIFRAGCVVVHTSFVVARYITRYG